MRGNIGANERGYNNTHKLDAMQAFDRLPRELREALRYADNNWSAAQLYYARRKPKAVRKAQIMTVQSTVQFLREQDATNHRKTYPDMYPSQSERNDNEI